MAVIAIAETSRRNTAAAYCKRARYAGFVYRLSSLAEVVRWGLDQQPPQVIAEIVVQDEYTHDVVIAWGEVAYAVFDTT